MNEQPLTLQEIHKETLVILKKIIAICDELHINYYIAYGSLIGVVRHQGFIPWDDDLDIMMFRPDYEKFKAYCLSHEAELFPFKLMGRYNAPNFPYNIDRFCDLRYRMVSERTTDAGMGMFIDIYPMDGAGNDKEAAAAQLKQKKFWLDCLFCDLHGKFEPSTRGWIYNVLKFPGYCYARLRGSKYFLDKLESLKNLYTVEQSRYVACMIWDWPLRFKEKAWFDNATEMPFEDMMVKVPGNYDAMLRDSYGDYMQLPPEDKRVPHHEYSLYRKAEFFEK